MLLEQVAKTCRDECGMDTARVVLVGVSGGPDSLCLLDLLARLDYPLVVAHFNHALRPEADEDARHVEAIAGHYGFPFVTARDDIRAFADHEHLSLEEAARIARYRFLFAQAARMGAQAVATGHTADDQVETTLMHLLRGAGLAGLRGMPWRGLLPEWDETIPLVRPLLGIWREETAGYCRERGLDALQDASNQDLTFFRNRLRNELIPYLQGYNPQVKEAVWRMAQVLAGDEEVLEEDTRRAWQECDGQENGGLATLSLTSFLGLSTALQRRVLRRAVAHLRPGLRDVDYATIERGITFARSPGRARQMDFIQGLRLAVQDNRLFLSEWGAVYLDEAFPRMQLGLELELPFPGRLELLDGWKITADAASLEDFQRETEWREDPYQVWLDADAIEPPLRVRVRRSGDRFKPLGLNGHSIKLSDFWVNQRLPREARSSWPLIFSGKSLAWIPLYRPAEPFKVTETTRRLIHLSIGRNL